MRYVKFAVAAGALLAVGAAASAQGATVYYSACDALTSTETVKIKRVSEDGSGAATVADTTVAACGDYYSSARWVTGLAIHDGYAYFSWLAPAGSSTGIGRVPLDGGAADISFIPGPTGVPYLKMNANVADGHLYAYADDGASGGDRSNPRVVRVSPAGGAFATVIAGANPGNVGFGIANDALYYSDNNVATLLKRNLDGGGSAQNVYPAGFPFGSWLKQSQNASMVAGSSSVLFLDTLDTAPLTNDVYGISTLTPASSPTSFSAYGLVPQSYATAEQVWSGSYLYFAQAASSGTQTAIGRVKEDGSDLNRAWQTSPMIHQIAIGPSLPAVSPSGGSSTSPPTTKSSLNNVLNTKVIKKVTNLSSGGRPAASVPCSTTSGVLLKECKVEILVTQNNLKRLNATAPKTTVIGTATKKAATGTPRISVRVPIRNKKARTALANGKRVKATIRMTVTGADGSTGTASKATTLVVRKAKGTGK